jgi:5-methylcytosine-specific restriction protein B
VAFEPVEAVFVWKYTKSPFAACYGRLPGTKYSKDFLQSPAEQFPELDRALGWEAGQVNIEYRWPGGSRAGFWRHSSADERGQLAWPASSAPDPWKVGDPGAHVQVTFPGDPGALNEQDADSQFDRLEALNLDPYIIAVKLQRQDKVLHVRACVKHPTIDLEKRSVGQLPAVLRTAIENLPTGGTALRFEPSAVFRDEALVNRIIETLEHEPNVLLVGPPGTGKTVALEDLRSEFERNSLQLLFDPDRWLEKQP